MDLANQQVITAFEQEGLMPEDIATDLGWEVEAVKAILLQGSKKFQQLALSKNGDTGELELANEQVFGRGDMELAKGTIKQLMVTSDIDSVRFKCAEFVINEVKGRNDLKALKENKFNIVMISETMAKARQAMRDAKMKAVGARTLDAEVVAA